MAIPLFPDPNKMQPNPYLNNMHHPYCHWTVALDTLLFNFIWGCLASLQHALEGKSYMLGHHVP